MLRITLSNNECTAVKEGRRFDGSSSSERNTTLGKFSIRLATCGYKCIRLVLTFLFFKFKNRYKSKAKQNFAQQAWRPFLNFFFISFLIIALPNRYGRYIDSQLILRIYIYIYCFCLANLHINIIKLRLYRKYFT